MSTTASRGNVPISWRGVSWRRALALVLVAGAGFAVGGAEARAQLAEASATTLGLSGAHTATVRGFGAISVNPAGLGTSGSGFSLAVVPIQARGGSGPVTFSDLADHQGRVVPTAVKEEWLSAIEGAGGQSALGGLDVSGFALAVGRFGVQLSTTSSADVTLPPGVAEALLFGNAGRTGQATTLDLTGLGVDAFAATTGAASVAFPLGPAVVGVTGKYTVGHGLALARAGTGAVSTDPIRLTLESPAVAPCADEVLGQCRASSGNNGSGFGADVGIMMDLAILRLGASVINVVNTFSWDVETLSYRPGTAVVEEGAIESDFEEAGYDGAPADLRAAVEGFTFEPTVRLGAAMDVSRELTVSADVHHRVSEDAIALGPRSQLGVGAEWRGLPWLHLRGGAGVVSGGTQLSGGASLVLGSVNLSVAGALRDREAFDRTTLGQLTLSFGGR